MYNTLRTARQIIKESPYTEEVQERKKKERGVRVTRTSLGRVSSPLQAVVPTQHRGTGY